MKPLPNNSLPFLNANGIVSQPWFFFFQSIVGPANPIQVIIVGASPFAYTASENGSLSVSGGTVTGITITRGQTTISCGLTSGLVPVRQNDIVEITYAVLPTVNFIPG